MYKISIDTLDPITAHLSQVAGRATTHTYTRGDSLLACADDAERQLADLGIPQKDRVGASYDVISGPGPLPNAYKGTIRVTRATLLRRAAGWYLVEAQTIDSYPQAKRGGTLALTEEQDTIAMTLLRKRYKVKKPAQGAL